MTKENEENNDDAITLVYRRNKKGKIPIASYSDSQGSMVKLLNDPDTGAFTTAIVYEPQADKNFKEKCTLSDKEWKALSGLMIPQGNPVNNEGLEISYFIIPREKGKFLKACPAKLAPTAQR